MASNRASDLALVSQLRLHGRRRRVGWIAAQCAWAAMAFLVMASPWALIGAGAQESNTNGVPVEIIRFDRGASSKDVSGSVIRGERSLYSIDARSGQRLSVGISAEENNAVFQIYAPGARSERRGDYGVDIVGAKTLPRAGEGEDTTQWSDILPVTGSYLVVVGPTRGNATYTLRVTIR